MQEKGHSAALAGFRVFRMICARSCAARLDLPSLSQGSPDAVQI